MKSCSDTAGRQRELILRRFCFSKRTVYIFFIFKGNCCVAPGRLEVNKGRVLMRKPDLLYAINSPIFIMIKQFVYHTYM